MNIKQVLTDAGFQRCQQPPAGWSYEEMIYSREVAQGTAYVLCPGHAAEVEVFVGHWLYPTVHFAGPMQQAASFLRLLAA